MRDNDLQDILAFLRTAEGLKHTLRSGYTSSGRQESVAEHTWRLCLMAVLFRDRFPEADLDKLVRMLLVHDLGEVLHGDVPAPSQAGTDSKSERERSDFAEVTANLPAPLRDELRALWDEYEAAATAEARLAKGLDKLETILQHNQGLNPPGFDYAFNLRYGQAYTSDDPRLAAIRTVVDRDTARLAADGERAAAGASERESGTYIGHTPSPGAPMIAPSLPVSLIDIDSTFLPLAHMRQVNRIVALAGPEITGEMEIGPDHWVFREHFPDDPIYPGTLLIEAAGQMVALWAWANGQRGRPRLVKTTAEFHHPVGPDVSHLTLRAWVRRKRHINFGVVHVLCGATHIATMEAVLVILA